MTAPLGPRTPRTHIRTGSDPEGGSAAHGVFGEPVNSTQNALVKRAASLRLRKFRLQHRAFLVEGADLVAAGVASGRRPQVVFVVEGALAEAQYPLTFEGGGALPVTAITQRVAEKLTTLETPPAMMAVFPELQPPPLAALRSAELLAVYADRIADPGNLGTLMRAAAAFGAAALLCSPGCADPFAPKVVRASMGAVFSLALYAEQPLAGALSDLAPVRAYGLTAHGGADLATAALQRPAVLCVGAERAGLSPEVVQLVEPLTIRLTAGAPAIESLNAGVAGAIALYEFSRRAGAPTTSGG